MSGSHRLNKSLFAAGTQCAKRLHQEFHDPDSVPAPSESRQALAEVGRRLTEMAREGFPRAQRIEHEQHDEAVAETRAVLDAASGVAVFDAAFERDGVEVRCDIVLPGREPNQLDIFEVKSGTKVKPRHVMDIALQIWVIEGSGYTVGSASVLHLDAEYRHSGSKTYPVHKLFKNVDVTKKARRRKRRIPDLIENFQHVLDDETTLDLPMGTWCINPIPCGYLEKCSAAAPPNQLLELPELTPAQESSLHQEGIETIEQISTETTSLTRTQRRVLRALETGSLMVDPTVHEEFETVIFPLCFMATSLSLQVLPRFAHSRPWQQLPYLWSAHILHEDGRIEQRSFVSATEQDPRGEFLSRFLEGIDDLGTVFTWSRAFLPCVRQVMEDVSELREEAKAVLQMDPVELDSQVRQGIYHPAMRGDFSLFEVRDALVGARTRGEGIVDDEGARSAYERLLNSRTRSTTRNKLQAELLAYGAARSAAMLEIYQAIANAK
ncbi:MAG: DUF2779 domain-containing protein [Planctomycetes bacterium]|nr:DUF2779 domain-containing protein [Planctomycetota bacterium]